MVNLGLVRADQSGTCQRRADCGDAAHDSKPGTNTYRSGAEPVTEGVEPLPREQGISLSDDGGWKPGQVPNLPKDWKEGVVYGTMPRLPEAGTGRILVYPCEPDEDGMLSAHWEGGSDGEAKPMRFTSAKGYAPAVIMWAHHMPSAETKICLTRDEIWLDLNEDYYNELMRVLSSTG